MAIYNEPYNRCDHGNRKTDGLQSVNYFLNESQLIEYPCNVAIWICSSTKLHINMKLHIRKIINSLIILFVKLKKNYFQINWFYTTPIQKN